jgi:ATP-dependent DNA helicase RecG
VITGRPEREIVPEYPAAAVREAVVNAICHRDYTHASTVQIRIFDDRLEVWNPGTLPPGLTVEGLYHRHSSQPRNRQLAMGLYRARLIEQWGTGTLRIVEACEARGMPRPEFITDMGCFIVCFRKPAAGAQRSGRPAQEERYRQALVFVREHGRITRGQYRELVGVSRAQALRDLSGLVERGLLTREGQGPAAHYLLPDGL